MGGQNHQPCNRYLIESTELSKSLSLGRIGFESANVAVENLLLAELHGNPFEETQLDEVGRSLHSSIEALNQMQRWLDAIGAKLNDVEGWEPPTVGDCDWASMGDALATIEAVDAKAWSGMADIRVAEGFPGVIRHFSQRIALLCRTSGDLIEQFEALDGDIRCGSFEKAVEGNAAGDFKILFARLYNGWAQFQQDFLASALLSTESWYRWTNCGSLVELSHGLRRVA